MTGNNGVGEVDWGGFSCFTPFGRDDEILEDLEIFNHMPGWRLCLSHLALEEEATTAGMQLATRGTLAGLHRRFEGRSLDEDHTIRAVRDALAASGEHVANRSSTCEQLISRIMGGEEFPRTGLVPLDFRNLLALRTLLPWSVVDATRVDFPLTFRPGRDGEKGVDGHREVDVCDFPVVVDGAGEVHCCPSTCPGGRCLGDDTTQVLLFCFTPLAVAHEFAARKQLSQLISLTGAFRFVETRAYRPDVRPE